MCYWSSCVILNVNLIRCSTLILDIVSFIYIYINILVNHVWSTDGSNICQKARRTAGRRSQNQTMQYQVCHLVLPVWWYRRFQVTWIMTLLLTKPNRTANLSMPLFYLSRGCCFLKAVGDPESSSVILICLTCVFFMAVNSIEQAGNLLIKCIWMDIFVQNIQLSVILNLYCFVHHLDPVCSRSLRRVRVWIVWRNSITSRCTAWSSRH